MTQIRVFLKFFECQSLERGHTQTLEQARHRNLGYSLVTVPSVGEVVRALMILLVCKDCLLSTWCSSFGGTSIT